MDEQTSEDGTTHAVIFGLDPMHPAGGAQHKIDRLVMRCQELEGDLQRMRAALAQANSQAEHFEREWYLRGDELERLRPLTVCGCGDHFSEHDPGTCGICVAAMTSLPGA